MPRPGAILATPNALKMNPDSYYESIQSFTKEHRPEAPLQSENSDGVQNTSSKSLTNPVLGFNDYEEEQRNDEERKNHVGYNSKRIQNNQYASAIADLGEESLEDDDSMSSCASDD
jgi:hypothetical protein